MIPYSPHDIQGQRHLVGPRIPIIHTPHERAWPKSGDQAAFQLYLPLPTALTRRFGHDAHMAAYSVPIFPKRLSRDALAEDARLLLLEGIPMVVFLADVDCELVHRATGGVRDATAPDAWWQDQLSKLQALAQVHPGFFAYRTRGGFRLLFRLSPPVVLRQLTDAEVWSAHYLTWVAYLTRRFGLRPDPACKDWQRLYRLPHATRVTGGSPEERETLGDPRNIGSWQCEATAEDVALAQTLSRRKAAADRSARRVRAGGHVSGAVGEGVLYHAFQARRWLGHHIEPGTWAAVCPWEEGHTKGTRYDTSTVLFVPGESDTLGWWHCSHAHCAHRDLRDVLALFTPGELDRAREASGLITRTSQGLRLTRARGRLRTIAATEVMPWR